jgi:hypothetical protein
MRAFLADLDREVALAAIAGVVIGLIWLAWTGPGFVLAWSALVAGVLTWILRRRWLEVGVLLVTTAAVPAIGYRLLGPPAIRATVVPDVIPVEDFAPGAADLLVVTGLVSLAVVTILAVRDGRRREQLIAEKEARRRSRLRQGA